MASLSASPQGQGAGTGVALLGCVARQGSASHPYVASEALLRGPGAARNLADAIHLVCALHGRHPGIVDLAAGRISDPESLRWLNQAADTFAAERALLTRTAVAAGPIPSTPGGAGSEAAVLAQRSAVQTLAQSERRGCALGAAIAFVFDWAAIRNVIDAAARRFGLDVTPFALDDRTVLAQVADHAAELPAVARAMMFGGEQIALQHRGLWDLLQARAEARLA